jgi:hypothetical protein
VDQEEEFLMTDLIKFSKTCLHTSTVFVDFVYLTSTFAIHLKQEKASALWLSEA